MEKFEIWEGHLPALEKKVSTIQRKCARYGTPFRFAKTGETMRDVRTGDVNPLTGKPVTVSCKYITIEVEGTAVINGWRFVASVEKTPAGNLFSKALTDVEIPERYRTADLVCEHCHSNRSRKSTFIIVSDSGEFKMVGQDCLMDYTHGMSASWAAYMASLRSVFAEAEEAPVSGFNGWYRKSYDTREFLLYTAETIRQFGFSKSSDSTSTRSRVREIWDYTHGETRYWMPQDLTRVQDLLDRTGFDPESEEARTMTEKALAWIADQPARNDYMHNLKTVASLDRVDSGKFGLLVSLFPTWNREIEEQAKREAERAKGQASRHVGEIGDRITVSVDSIKCITSWDNCFNGYSSTTTYLWRIVGRDGNIYTWKTASWFDTDCPPAELKGTVKAHTVFRDVEQTELTRCKVM